MPIHWTMIYRYPPFEQPGPGDQFDSISVGDRVIARELGKTNKMADERTIVISAL